MTPLHAAILGLVEGITEYLPVSSTGHLIITSSLLGLDRDPATKSAVDAFNIVIQGGAILAVVGLYWPRIVQMMRGLIGLDPAGRKLLIHLVIAFLPAAALGPLLDDQIERWLFHPGPVLAALLLGGVWMILLDLRQRRMASRSGADRTPSRNGQSAGEAGSSGEDRSGTIDTMTWKQALGIGIFQCVAMWPGTSRSMMTIAGGMMTGLKPAEAAQFSFLLGLPTLGAACVYKLAKNLKESSESGTPNLFEQLGTTNVLIGMAVAMVSAGLAVKWLVSFLNRRGLGAFGWYRVVLCAVMGLLIAGGVVRMG